MRRARSRAASSDIFVFMACHHLGFDFVGDSPFAHDFTRSPPVNVAMAFLLGCSCSSAPDWSSPADAAIGAAFRFFGPFCYHVK